MNASEFRTSLKGGLSGVYLFYGREEYLKHHCLALARESIITDPAAEAFDRTVLDSQSFSDEALYAALDIPPMLSEKRLIEVHELDLMRPTKERLEQLCSFADTAAEYDGSVVIIYTAENEFDPGTAKQPSSALKQLSGHLTPVAFDRETPARLQKWVYRHFSADGIEADPTLCSYLIDKSGRDMYNLIGEISKLSAYVRSCGRSKLLREDIDYITVDICEIDPFDFANAILEHNTDRAFAILREYRLRREPPELLLAGISRVYGDMLVIRELTSSGMSLRDVASKLKMHEFRVGLYHKNSQRRSRAELSRAIELCSAADADIKSTGLDSYTVIERLIAQTALAT